MVVEEEEEEEEEVVVVVVVVTAKGPFLSSSSFNIKTHMKVNKKQDVCSCLHPIATMYILWEFHSLKMVILGSSMRGSKIVSYKPHVSTRLLLLLLPLLVLLLLLLLLLFPCNK